MKKRKRLNAVDLMLILLLTLCLLSTVLRYRTLVRDGTSDSLSEYRVVVRFENLDAALADSLLAGERARLLPEDVEASIASVSVTDAVEMLLSGGVQHEAIWERGYRCTLLVTIDVQGGEAGGVLYLDGRYAKALSDTLTICTDRTKMTGTVISFAPLSKLRLP